jgi:pyruvate kinase
MKRTKIVATTGPTTDPDGVFEEIIKGGVDVLRYNFSHGTQAEHKMRLDHARQAAANVGVPVAMMMDTKGPEVRIGTFAEGPAELIEGEEFILSCTPIDGDKHAVSVSYANLWQETKPGARILIDDGLIELIAERIEGTDIICSVINGGEISNNKSVNLPETNLNLATLSERDISDLRFAIENGFDYIAASFIRSPSDIYKIRGICDAYGGPSIPIIAKIENREGADNAAAILKASDGIMVARGDLGMEIPSEEVPIVQKTLIKLCNEAGKPVITATQMLDSMIRNPRPTRAEVADVANAVLDGSDAVMLSGETAAGKFPVASVDVMRKTIERAEELYNWQLELMSGKDRSPNVVETIAFISCHASQVLGTKFIITPTASGYTPRAISKYRPQARIVAVTGSEDVQRSLCLYWGIEPMLVKGAPNITVATREAANRLLAEKKIEPSDFVVITAGLNANVSGTTNTLRIEKASSIASARV